jgi:hypothetical protein
MIECAINHESGITGIVATTVRVVDQFPGAKRSRGCRHIARIGTWRTWRPMVPGELGAGMKRGRLDSTQFP